MNTEKYIISRIPNPPASPFLFEKNHFFPPEYKDRSDFAAVEFLFIIYLSPSRNSQICVFILFYFSSCDLFFYFFFFFFQCDEEQLLTFSVELGIFDHDFLRVQGSEGLEKTEKYNIFRIHTGKPMIFRIADKSLLIFSSQRIISFNFWQKQEGEDFCSISIHYLYPLIYYLLIPFLYFA